MSDVVARYLEFAPCAALAKYVRALFLFTIGGEKTSPADVVRRRPSREIHFREGEPFWSALFADGHASIVASWRDTCRIQGVWESPITTPHVIGAMSHFRPTSYGPRLAQVGAYMRPGYAQLFTHVPAHELTDRVVALDELPDLESQLGEAASDEQRIGCFEAALLKHMRPMREPALAVTELADAIAAQRGQLRIDVLADQAGVSRQHLSRVFRESVGIGPKLYSRLARFQGALRRAASGSTWAQTAVELGYADQSHLIAEFREFSGLTPEAFSKGAFHPFQQR